MPSPLLFNLDKYTNTHLFGKPYNLNMYNYSTLYSNQQPSHYKHTLQFAEDAEENKIIKVFEDSNVLEYNTPTIKGKGGNVSFHPSIEKINKRILKGRGLIRLY